MIAAPAMGAPLGSETVPVRFARSLHPINEFLFVVSQEKADGFAQVGKPSIGFGEFLRDILVPHHLDQLAYFFLHADKRPSQCIRSEIRLADPKFLPVFIRILGISARAERPVFDREIVTGLFKFAKEVFHRFCGLEDGFDARPAALPASRRAFRRHH